MTNGTGTKPGWTTSEAWGTVVFVLAMVVAGLQASDADWALKLASIIAAGLSAAGYAISRGLAKK